MSQEIEATEEIKTGELTVQNYEIVGFDESIIPVNRVAELKEKFVPMLQTFETHNENREAILEEFKQYTESGTAAPKELIARAKRHRLDIGKIRVAIEKARKATNDEINKQKAGTDSLCKFISENITKDEKEMAEKETHNDKIEADRLKIVQDERSKLASEYGFTEEMDFSGMAQTVFDSFIAGLKATRKEEEEAKLKQDLRISRQTECLNLSEFIEHYDAIDLAELSEDQYKSLLDTANKNKVEYDEAVKVEAEKKAVHEERKSALSHVSYLIEDFELLEFGDLLGIEFNDFKESYEAMKLEQEQKQEEIRLENERLKAEKEEAEKIEAARIKKEEIAQKKRDNEKEESDRLARLQVLSQQRSDSQAAEAIEKQEAAERRERDAIATTERLEREKLEAEEKRVEEIKSLTKACSEITPEQLERAKAEGKTVFVKVVSIDFIEGQAGIFIQSSDN